ncbi:MAG TPA: transcriptional regulator, partial [Albitalea sp.]|nr:transcriptional regulator [Albitalea sp.]
MRRHLMLWIVLLGCVACSGTAATVEPAEPAETAHASADPLPAYQPRFGRSRPLVVVVAENYYTELTDYVVPYGILAASGAADVMALATQPGPIRMF